MRETITPILARISATLNKRSSDPRHPDNLLDKDWQAGFFYGNQTQADSMQDIHDEWVSRGKPGNIQADTTKFEIAQLDGYNAWKAGYWAGRYRQIGIKLDVMKPLFLIASFSLALVGALIAAEPPTPPQPVDMGRQHPYLSSVSVLVTQTVTTVFQVKYLRSIEVQVGTNTVYETNFMTMRTNVVSVVTNTVGGL